MIHRSNTVPTAQNMSNDEMMNNKCGTAIEVHAVVYRKTAAYNSET
jgi:hypothetical protein